MEMHCVLEKEILFSRSHEQLQLITGMVGAKGIVAPHFGMAYGLWTLLA